MNLNKLRQTLSQRANHRQREILDPSRIYLRDKRTLLSACRDALDVIPKKVNFLGDGRSGSWSYKLQLGKGWIKAYECESESKAGRVIRATKILSRQGIPVPEILSSSGHVVFAEWIDGKPLSVKDNERAMEKMINYQRRIHTVKINQIKTSDAQVVHLNWLLKRLNAFAEPYLEAEAIKEIDESIRKLVPPKLEVRIVHPDFIKANLVVNTADELVIVDNEFLDIGKGYEYDILNAAISLFPKDKARQIDYIKTYAGDVGCGSLLDRKDFWDICFLVKIAGKRFMQGKVSDGKYFFNLIKKRLRDYYK